MLLFVASVALAGGAIGKLGWLYGPSALIQELCLLSIAFLLLPTFPIYIVVLLIVPLFVFCHQLTKVPYALTRALLIAIWGTAALIIFSYTRNLFLVASLHVLLGTVLIAMGVLHPQYETSFR